MTTSQLDTMYTARADFGTFDEIYAAARRTLPPDVFDFVEGGAGREVTLHDNRTAFNRWRILPEPMSGVANPCTRTSLLGITLETPILTAPFGGDTMFNANGHFAVALAAQQHGTISIVPEVGSFSFEQVRAVAPTAARVAQLHPFAHAPAVAERIYRAGYTALCVTVDCPVGGFRTRDVRNRFAPDIRHFSGNLTGRDGTPEVTEFFDQLLRHSAEAWTWADLTEAADSFRLPWIAKGVLSAEAADRAVAAGASAIVVSNHGGRQVDPAPASLVMLPLIRSAAGPDLPILFDSGIRTGSDVFLALALGADAVLIGRAAIYGLAAAGEAGVSRVLELLTTELRTLMTLSGATTIDQVDATRLIGAMA